MHTMRFDELSIQLRRAALIFLLAIITASCSRKAAPEPDKGSAEASPEVARESHAEGAQGRDERRPEKGQIGEDCAAFVHSTRVVPARTASANCPQCPAGGTNVFSFRGMKTDAVSCSRDSCTVTATMRAVFTPGEGETITGGLTAWIPAEQRTAYLSGQVPPDEQTFHVQITYGRRGESWRAVEFDRATSE